MDASSETLKCTDLISKFPKAAILCSKSGLWLNNERYIEAAEVFKKCRLSSPEIEYWIWNWKLYPGGANTIEWIRNVCSLDVVFHLYLAGADTVWLLYGFLNPFDKYMFVNWKGRRRSLWKDFFLFFYPIMLRLVFVVCRLCKNGFLVMGLVNLYFSRFINTI